MKATFINSLGALAFAGLSVSLIPAPAVAGNFPPSEHHHSCPERLCGRLPHGEEPVVEDSAVAEDDTVIETLPENCLVEVIDGERCWSHNGVYYRSCDRGYKLCHPHSDHLHRGSDHHQTAINHGDKIHHAAHEASAHIKPMDSHKGASHKAHGHARPA